MPEEKNARICATTGCMKPGKLCYPICLKNKISVMFCDQACFKSFYKRHKIAHKLLERTKVASEATKNLKGTQEEFFSGCASGFIPAIENALDHGIDINVRGRNSLTALHFAAMSDQ